MALLEMTALSIDYASAAGPVHAVRNVDLAVERGEVLGLVGESGSGKSTLVSSMMALLPGNARISGELRFQGRDLAAMGEGERRGLRGNGIAAIFQDPFTALNPVVSIGTLLVEIQHHKCERSRAERKARALAMLRSVGISDPERRLPQYPHQFSGGMRQRMMIAMALSCNPSLILADEPTTALDVTIQAQILELMKDLSRRFGVALLIITHNLGVVARYADRVNVMYAGRIIERGTARELYANPRHPYTLGLLRSVPRLDEPRRARLDPIEGQPPDLTRLPAGCAFAPRCAFSVDRCRVEVPPLRQVNGAGHVSACWEAENLRGARSAAQT